MINKLKVFINRFLSPEAFIEVGAELRSKVIIITGASSGIGKATAELLRKKGATLVLVSRHVEKTAKMTKNKRQLILIADVVSESDCQKVVKATLEKFGRIDCLINNAGLFIDKSLEKTTLLDFKKIIDTNLIGMFNMSRLVVATMKKQKSGTIINIGSKISHNTNVAPNKVAYATSKYAVEGFSFSLNKELKTFGIRVCCLMPGTVATFVSRKGRQFMSPYDVARLVKIIIESDKIDFESIVFKSINQNI